MLALVDALILASFAAIFFVERAAWPRIWVKTVLVDPEVAPRDRYVRLRIEFDAGSQLLEREVTLSVRSGRLVAEPAAFPTGIRLVDGRSEPSVGGIPRITQVQVSPPLTVFFPTQLTAHWPPEEEIWAEVTVPARGSPRPIRLGVKKNGILTPF
jgi:hypothetical protein